MAHGLHPELEPLNTLRHLPFVKNLKYQPAKKQLDEGHGGRLQIATPQGRYQLRVESNRSFQSRSSASRVLAWLNHTRTDRTQSVILLTRHVPRRAAESFIDAGVNFVDDAGNVHLRLGDAYNWTAIGNPPAQPLSERRPVSPAQMQLLFQFVTHPDSVSWPVRRLESAAGISKSMAAQARRQMIAAGLLSHSGKQYRLGPASLLADTLIQGYAQVLRPKLTLGTFRSIEKTPEAFLSRLRKELPPGVRYSLSGGAAAGLLQNFYRGSEIVLFLNPSTRAVARQLHLLPDREGRITILNAFGDLVFGEQRKHHTLAPPWLIYAELLNSEDPRAHEAAREFRQQFLT